MHKPNIFVIDDDPAIQEVISSYIQPRGYEVKSFSTAEEGLAEIDRNPHNCDILITDLYLPKMTGYQLIHAMKENHPKIPIILITSYKDSETAVQAIREGAYDFVVKPIHFQQLLVSIERTLFLNKIKEENSTLRLIASGKDGLIADGIIGKSPAFLKIIDLAKRVAVSNANILITGESGTGKEIIARLVHQFSNRKNKPFVAINCSAIPENLLESELFGYTKGAFTGALDKKLGLLEEAEGGTLFLDEIGDLSLSFQAKLLRVIQERKIKRLGENQTRKIDIRIISATHKNLREEISEKRFREDFYFRIDVIPIHIPALRNRIEDIFPLAEFFIKKFSVLNQANISGISKDALNYLYSNPWQGNVRELENAIERAVVLRGEGDIELEDLVFETEAAPQPVNYLQQVTEQKKTLLSLEELNENYILHALKQNGGARDKTAKILGIDRKTLYRKIHDLQAKGMGFESASSLQSNKA